MALARREPWDLLARPHRFMTFDFLLHRAAITGLTGLLLTASLIADAQQDASAAESSGVTRYSATTANMEPDGLNLRFDVLTWSDEAARSAVVAALESEDAQAALDELPTAGYVWPEGSPVGYAIKYAHRAPSDGGERLTFVTSKPLGSYDFGGWTVQGEVAVEELEYSVIELDVGEGASMTGTASLAAPVSVDAAAALISLDRPQDARPLFTDVHRLELGY